MSLLTPCLGRSPCLKGGMSLIPASPEVGLGGVEVHAVARLVGAFEVLSRIVLEADVLGLRLGRRRTLGAALRWSGGSVGLGLLGRKWSIRPLTLAAPGGASLSVSLATESGLLKDLLEEVGIDRADEGVELQALAGLQRAEDVGLEANGI